MNEGTNHTKMYLLEETRLNVQCEARGNACIIRILEGVCGAAVLLLPGHLTC